MRARKNERKNERKSERKSERKGEREKEKEKEKKVGLSSMLVYDGVLGMIAIGGS